MRSSGVHRVGRLYHLSLLLPLPFPEYMAAVPPFSSSPTPLLVLALSFGAALLYFSSLFVGCYPSVLIYPYNLSPSIDVLLPIYVADLSGSSLVSPSSATSSITIYGGASSLYDSTSLLSYFYFCISVVCWGFSAVSDNSRAVYSLWFHHCGSDRGMVPRTMWLSIPLVLSRVLRLSTWLYQALRNSHDVNLRLVLWQLHYWSEAPVINQVEWQLKSYHSSYDTLYRHLGGPYLKPVPVHTWGFWFFPFQYLERPSTIVWRRWPCLSHLGSICNLPNYNCSWITHGSYTTACRRQVTYHNANTPPELLYM